MSKLSISYSWCELHKDKWDPALNEVPFVEDHSKDSNNHKIKNLHALYL